MQIIAVVRKEHTAHDQRPLRARAPRYFDRKPGWIVQEIRDMQRRQTDWQFMASHGYSPKRWDT